MIDVNLSRKANGVGVHDQIIHFMDGSKRLIQGVQYIWEQQEIHIVDYLGVEYIINRANWKMVERVSRGGEGHGRAKTSDANRKPARGKRGRKTK